MEKYVVFEAQHMSSLYQYITLRYTRYRNKNVILFINKAGYDKTTYAQNLVKYGVFKQIVAYSEPTFKNSTSTDDFVKFFDDIFANNQIELKDAEEIITAADVQNIFAIYCILNNRTLTYMEMHDNQFKDYNRYSVNRILGVSSKFVEDISIKYGVLTGDKANAKKRYLYAGSKVENSRKDEVVNFLDDFFSLDRKDVEVILRCFEIDNIDGKDIKNVLLFNSVGWTYPQTKLGYPTYYLPFLLIADYYFSDTACVYVKDHPQNNNDVYSKIIVPYCKTIKADVPIEFLGLINNLKVDKLISIDSTGGAKISRFVKNEVKLGRCYLSRGYFCNHKLYASLKVFSFINENLKPFSFGVDFDYLNSFNKNAGVIKNLQEFTLMNIKQLQKNSFNIVGHYANNNYRDIENLMLKANESSVIVFFNFDAKKLISHNNLSIIDNLIPLHFNVDKTRASSIASPIKASLVVFTKSQEIKNKLLEFNYSKELTNMGAVAYINKPTNEELEKDLMQMKLDVLYAKIEEQQKQIESLKNKG